VRRLRAAGGIPIAKTNLPDLLFSFETDNLVFGRTNNPYDVSRTPGGSSGGESALIAAGGSPLGLGSDCAGSVRLPAAFCGLAAMKPTSGRLPRTGHVPPFGGWIEKLWQIGPIARSVDDVVLAIRLLSGEDGSDWTAPHVPVLDVPATRVAFFIDNGLASCDPAIQEAVQKCAAALERGGMSVEEKRPPGVEQAYELELAILGADGGDGIDAYLREIGSAQAHPLLTAFVDRTRPFRATGTEFARRWAQWDSYIASLMKFFGKYDAVLCPVYTQAALKHGQSVTDENFLGFSYTMAWNVAGFPAATVRCSEKDGLPINVQVVAKPWREMAALQVCKRLEEEFGGWKSPPTVSV
jgi:amidase